MSGIHPGGKEGRAYGTNTCVMRGRAGKKGLLVEGWDIGLVGAEAGS